MLAPQYLRDLGGKTPEGHTVGVHHVPLALNVAFLYHCRSVHVVDLISFESSFHVVRLIGIVSESDVVERARIPNSHEGQALRGKDRRKVSFAPQKLASVFSAALAPAHLEQETSDPPHHPSEEGRAHHIDPQLVPNLGYFDRAKLSDAIPNCWIELRGEAAKIMLPDEFPCHRPHG